MGKRQEMSSTTFQRNVAKHLEEVLRGTTIVITRWKRPIAELRPIADKEPKEDSEHEI